MKIGILTFHRAHNYGAVLQCYALQEVLKSMGHEVSVIDYKLQFLLECYKPFILRRFLSKNPIKCLDRIIRETKLLHSRRDRWCSFNNFIETRLNIAPIESLEQNLFDVIVIGSDQVWNTKLTHGFDNYYWGNFKTRAKIVSYAASIEEFWDVKDNKKVRTLLNNFSSISVREEDVALNLKNIIDGRTIHTVVDPTLLLGNGEWSKIAVQPPIRKKYLLLYQVRDSQTAKRIASKIAHKYQLEIIALSARVDAINSKECISASPEEFVGWFKYASFIVSSSFHGTVFSIIFQRPFYSVKLNDGKDSRVENLLKSFNLSERLICSYEDTCDLMKGTYESANGLRCINDSIRYIKENLL